MSCTYCPATMCPLFAADGSPWTGDKNAVCPERAPPDEIGVRYDRSSACGFWQMGVKDGCGGAFAAYGQVVDAMKQGGTLQLGPKRGSKTITPREYDCPRASDCQWQRSAGDKLCPPRTALREGVDPRYCAY